jgi:hypothetical protein
MHLASMRKQMLSVIKKIRDYEIHENDEINENLIFFRLFRHFRVFRNPL